MANWKGWIVGVLICGILGCGSETEQADTTPAPSTTSVSNDASEVKLVSYEAPAKPRMSVEEALTSAPTVKTLPPPIKPDDQLRAELPQTIRRAADYLVRTCDENGKLIYRLNTNPDVKLKPRYNIIRHAGAVYSLGMAYEYDPQPEVLDALLRAGAFLKREALKPIPESDQMLAIWSDSRLEGGDAHYEAKLGGTGLGLVGLMMIERIQPGFTPLEDLRKMGRFLGWMQKEDGSYYCKYDPALGGRDDSWISLYYPGEAALGLAMLYEHDPAPEWFATACRTIGYLARIRRDKQSVEADHWALLATARLFELSRDRRVPLDDPQSTLRHARQVCASMLEAMPRYDISTETAGCMTSDGRTCPTATRLEGTLAALTFLPKEDAELRNSVESAVHNGIAFLARTQISEGPYAGGLPRSAVAESARDDRATEIRVDYVQHAMSAMIQYERLFGTSASRVPSR